MAGNISTDPAVLADASHCFDTCIPPGSQWAVQTYLWAQIAGITDPAVILTNASCFQSCVPPGAELPLQAYLAAVLAGGSTDPSTLANAATCFSSCIPPGAISSVITYALANKAGGSTDPSTLVNAAQCFSSCIPPGFQLAAQNYLMAVAAGLSTDPQVLLSSAGFACFNCTITSGLAGSIIAQSVVTYTVGSLPPCSIPTGLTATWNATGHPASGTLDVSWGAVPAGIDNTEVWISFDDFTFVLADVVAAPGTTSHTGIIIFDPYVKIRFTINSPASTCSFTPAIQATIPSGPTNDPLVTSWQTRAIANGGTPSANTITCLNTFCVGIRAQTYFTKLKSVNFLAPDDFPCAMTPLIVHATDAGLWMSASGGFTGAGTAVTNGNAALGPLGFRSDRALIVSLTYTPPALFTARDNWGATIYTTTNDGLHGPDGWSFGVGDNTNYQLGTNNELSTTYLYADDGGVNVMQTPFVFYGYYSFNVSDATTRRIFAASSAHAHALFLSSGATFTGSLVAKPFGWAGFNNNDAAVAGSSNWYSFFAVHDALTAAESLDFFTRIQALRVCLGTGFV